MPAGWACRHFQKEQTMGAIHRKFLPLIVVIVTLRVKIVIRRR